MLEAAHQGVLSGNPVVDVKVTLTDGSYHAVDSSGMSFHIAAAQCMKKGLHEAHPVLLEPVMQVKVMAPDEFTGEVMGDLNAKRARVLGMNPQGGVTEIEAMAPLAEMQRYATALRSLTHGRGTYTMRFDHYDPAPPLVAQKVAEATAKELAAVGHAAH